MLLARRLSTQRAFVVRDEVRAAVAARRPVVALESTIITHGMPFPRNLEVARACEAAVRERGAVPATVAVLAGAVRVGLAEAELGRAASGRAGAATGPAARPRLGGAADARRPRGLRRDDRRGDGVGRAQGGRPRLRDGRARRRAPRRVRHAGRRVAINR